MNLFTNLRNPISSLYKYIFIHLHLQTYNIIHTYVEPHPHKVVHKHVIMFELSLLIVIYSLVHLQPVRHK